MIVFDKITTDILSNFKFQPIVTELLIHGRKLGFSFFYLILLNQNILG